MLGLQICVLVGDTFVGMAIAHASAAHSQIRDGIEVRLEHILIAEDLVSVGVQAIQRDAYICGCDPALQLGRLVERVGVGATLESTKRHVSSTQRSYITELVRTQRYGLIASGDDPVIGHAIRSLTIRAVVLIRLPVACLARSLVDGKVLGTRRLESHLNVGDNVGLAQVQGQIYVVRILHVKLHGVRLPPGGRVDQIGVGEILGRVGFRLHARVAHVTRVIRRHTVQG